MSGKCNLTDVRKLAMSKAQAKARELKDSGVPVTGEVFGAIVRQSFAEAKNECLPVSGEITLEQAAKVAKICPPCAAFYKVAKPKLKTESTPEAKPDYEFTTVEELASEKPT